MQVEPNSTLAVLLYVPILTGLNVAPETVFFTEFFRLLPQALYSIAETLYCYSLLIYIKKDATLHNLFYLETPLHVSGSTSTHHQESKQLHLHHLAFVIPLLLPTAIVEELEPV